MQNILNYLWKNEIGEPPWEYGFLYNLPESEYPKYLAKIFNYKTKEKLPLKWDLKNKSWIIDKNKCKTFNQKIQWLKLNDASELKRDCTDKVKVRDYVKERIGEEYLKPVLQVVGSEESGVRNNNLTTNSSTLNTPLFDKIDFDKLPTSFVIKCNHGCKWQYIIKDKNFFLNNKRLLKIVKQHITGWLEQEYWCFGGFEMQYKGIKPKILIEPLMRDEINKSCKQIQIYFVNNLPNFIIKLYDDNKVSLFDEKFNIIDTVLSIGDEKIICEADEQIYLSFDLSIKLLKNFNFKFVRVDWMIYKNKLYFEELTFTPYSGFKKLNKKLNFNI